MTILPLRCRQCGTLEDLISIIVVGPDRILISNFPPKQPSITDPKKVANCRRHGEVWCWACWSAQYPGPVPYRIDTETGKRIGRGESPRGGQA
jgi:hypothetical protein